MQVRRESIDTADPVEVYQLVKRALRQGPAAIEAASSADLRGLPARRLPARRSRSSSTRQKGRPVGGGVMFTDTFRNNFIERFWYAGSQTAAELGEGDSGIGTDTGGSQFPANLLSTISESYTNVRARASFTWFSVEPALVTARAFNDGTDLISGYIAVAIPATGYVGLGNVSGGVFTTNDWTILGPGVIGEEFTLALVCNGDMISVEVDGIVRLGPSMLKLFSSGAVGFGSLNAAEFVCTRFTASAPT